MRRIWPRTRTIRPGPWPYPRPRALIEHMDQATALRYVATLRRTGYSAGICPGPSPSTEVRERCVLTTGEPCQFVDGADVVVSGLGIGTVERKAVLEALRRYHPAKPLVVVVSLDEFHLYGDLLDGVHVVVEPVEPAELSKAVDDALTSRELASTR
jgi:hypothetical protein